MKRFAALLRGINVGTAKPIAMSELAAAFTGAGLGEVTTVLRSGNVVFEADAAPSATVLERAILDATGVSSSVLVLDAPTVTRIARANPLVDSISNGSKGFVTFLSGPHRALELPDAGSLAPELLTVTDEAVYQWMPDGSMQTKVPRAFWKQFDTPVTARNWNTVQKLLALLN